MKNHRNGSIEISQLLLALWIAGCGLAIFWVMEPIENNTSIQEKSCSAQETKQLAKKLFEVNEEITIEKNGVSFSISKKNGWKINNGYFVKNDIFIKIDN